MVHCVFLVGRVWSLPRSGLGSPFLWGMEAYSSGLGLIWLNLGVRGL